MKRKIGIIGIIVVVLVVVLTVALVGYRCQIPEVQIIEETTPPTTRETNPITTQAPETTTKENQVVVEEEEEEEAEEEIVEIVNAPEIEGLEFDQATRTYLAKKDNPYSLEEGEIAGVYVKDALTTQKAGETKIESGDVIGLNIAVIKVLLQELIKEKKLYLLPLIVDARVKNIQITELKSLLEGDTAVNLGLNVPVGTNFYSPIEPIPSWPVESGFYLEFASDGGFNSNESILNGTFDINLEDWQGYVMIFAMKQNLLLENKEIKENTMKTDEGEFIFKTVEFKEGELVGTVNDITPLRLWKDQKWLEDKGEHQIILFINSRDGGKGKDSMSDESRIFGLEALLKIDNKIVFILPNETAQTANNS